MKTPLILGALTLALSARAQNVATAGPYRVELRVPEGGLAAGATVDVEFRVSDTRRKDPIEGLAGVTDANPAATVTMPEMPGMPVQRPGIHREGVPGDYGLELFFPHGGAYKIGVRLAPTGGKPAYVEFRVDVKDAGTAAALPAPYRVRLIDPPKASGNVVLRLAVEDAKTGERVRRFDIAHTKPIHLMLMSGDLAWFAHEHPSQEGDGSFVWKGRIPTGGQILVFADVAPKDKGSQVLGTSLTLSGPRPLTVALAPNRRAVGGGLAATLADSAIPVGKTTRLDFRLRDAASGRPVTDLQPYLGAQGHLMVVSQDGKTFVHSHPDDSKGGSSGAVEFNARFPRKGLYKAWAQFQRRGQVVTLPFVFRVG